MEIKIKNKEHGDKTVCIDDEDYDKIKAYKWYISYEKKTGCYYAITKCLDERSNKVTTAKMHRIIMRPIIGEVIDHIDHDGLNNCKSNLRICSVAENGRNKIKRNSNSTSMFKGVSYKKSLNKFQAVIYLNYKQIFLGYLTNENEAALACNEAALKYHGDYACLNIVN